MKVFGHDNRFRFALAGVAICTCLGKTGGESRRFQCYLDQFFTRFRNLLANFRWLTKNYILSLTRERLIT